MSKCCVIVADRARARLFTIEEADSGDDSSAPQLVERADLVNPESKARGQGVFSGPDSRKRRAVAGSSQGYPDHRTEHAEEVDRGFARRIVSDASELIEQNKIASLVIVAPPHLLGLLRAQANDAVPTRVERVELAADLSWHTLPRIQEELTRHGVMPEQRPWHGRYRPHGQEP